MAELAYPYMPVATGRLEKKTLVQHVVKWAKLLPPLVMAALLADLLTPFLIWKRVLPGAAKWFGDLFILMMIGHAIVRMLRQDRIPPAFLLVVALSVVGSVVAVFEGQQWQATAWGIWLMFKYPMVGIYTYLHTKWLPDWPKKYFYFVVGLLVFEVGFQVMQFGLGAIPGDDLAGSFGWHGVAPLFMLLALALCFGFGHWLSTGEWTFVTISIVLGGLSSVLAEMKAFPLVILGVALISVSLLVIRSGKIGQALSILVILGVAAPAFGFLYNTLVADARGTRRIEEYFNAETTERYLDHTNISDTGIYYFGRGFAMEYAWNAIQRDGTTLVVGYGLGARADSGALGILGQALVKSDYGRTTPGTSMLILLQEMGLGGLAALGLFTVVFCVTLYNDMARKQEHYITTIRYGFLLFSALWPFWLWYTSSWHHSVTMMLYWGGVGYLFCHKEPPSKRNTPNLDWATVQSTPVKGI